MFTVSFFDHFISDANTNEVPGFVDDQKRLLFRRPHKRTQAFSTMAKKNIA
jgi:hypothetical protein